MTAIIETRVANAARDGQRVGVLVLVEKELHRGPAPLAIAGSLRTTVQRTQEVHHLARAFLLDPCSRTDRVSPPRMAPMAMAARTAARPGGVVLENLGAVMAAVDPGNLLELSQVPGVRKVIAIPQLMPLVHPLEYRVAAPASLVEGPVRSLVRSGVPALWEADLHGDGITIGHFDTGLNAGHPCFAELKVQRRLRYAAFAADGAKIARARPRDVDFGASVHHGTHTAGTLVGGSVDGMQIGIAPRAKLVSVQVFPQPAPSFADHDQLVVNALNWIVGEQPQVLNLSFGDVKYNDSYLGVIQELVDQGIVVVAAVGNGGATTSSSPGNYAEVISVGAVDLRGQVCSFSSSARVRRSGRPDVCAPGKDIISAGKGDEFAVSTGTSMAAPHVAGVLALLRQRAPELTPAQLKGLLMRAVRRPAGWDAARGGAGLLNGRALLSGL
jgi:subtilisin